MNLWTRFTARWKARKAERQVLAARKQHNRWEAQASLRRALALGAGTHISVYHASGSYEAHHSYHGYSGTDCSPGTSGDCSGTGI
jgi:hypothetical protein